MVRFLRFLPVMSGPGARVLLLLVALAAALATMPAHAGERVALVVGNSGYAKLDPLSNAATDARDIAAELERIGFATTLLVDADAATMTRTLAEFGERAAQAEATLFYFSGHGFQMAGQNYLVPVDASLSSVAAIEAETVRLDRIIEGIAARGRPTIVLLDACRNNPLPESMRDRVSQGLAAPETGRDTFVAFATQPGNVTFDGRAGENSPFTAALRRHLSTPGVSISEVMFAVRNEVERGTLGRQTPWEQSSLTQPFFANPFQPSDADYNSLIDMAPEARAFVLQMWQMQGAEIDEARLAPPAAEAPAAEAPPADTPGAGVPDGGDVTQVAVLVDPSPGGNTDRDSRDTGETRAIEAPQAAAPEPVQPDPVQPEPDLAPQPAAGVAQVPAVFPLPAVAAARPVFGLRASRVAEPLGAGQRRIIGTDVTPPELQGEPVPDNLEIALQEELRRVGCYRGAIDGDFGPGSRRALRSFLTETGASGRIGDDPTAEAWRLVRAAEGTVCAPPAPVVQQQQPRQQATTTARPAPAEPPPAAAPPPSNNGTLRLRGVF